jgi:hypothetical protein
MERVARFREDSKMGLRKFKDAVKWWSTVIGVSKVKTPDTPDEKRARVNINAQPTSYCSEC